MSDAGEIEVENTALYEVLPKDVVKEVGNVKLFNKWDYDVEVRDISLTYVNFSLTLAMLHRVKNALRANELLMEVSRQ